MGYIKIQSYTSILVCAQSYTILKLPIMVMIINPCLAKGGLQSPYFFFFCSRVALKR